jgi:hypothetical protein
MKIKIRQRFVNIKEKIGKPRTKKIIIFTVLGSIVLFYPLFGARALEEATKKVAEAAGVDNTPLLNKAGRKAKAVTLAATGLKVCMDPTAPPVRTAIAGAKIVCCGGYAGANLLLNMSLTPQVKIATSACCGAAWLTLSALEYIDSQQN